MVGQKSDGVEAEIGENLGADAVLVLQLALAGVAGVVHEIAAVGDHAGVAVGVLLNAEAGTGFVQVDQNAGACVGDLAQGAVDKAAAIAIGRAEDVAV